jgi:hypothetical protein
MLAASWRTDEKQPDDSIVGSVRDEVGLEPRQSEMIASTKQSDDILVSRIYQNLPRKICSLRPAATSVRDSEMIEGRVRLSLMLVRGYLKRSGLCNS